MIPRLFTMAVILTVLYGVALWMAFAIAVRRRAYAMARRKAVESAIPEIVSAVVDFAAGSNDPTRIRQLVKSHRDSLEECLLQYHATMSGEGRNRLAELALDIGLVHRWCQDAGARSPQRRQAALARLTMVAAHEPSRRISTEILHKALKDDDELARLEAARTLIHSGEEADVADIFQVAVSHSLLVRVILADELRRHVLMLCESVIPGVLRSEQTDRVIAALDMLAAWERAVPLPEIATLAVHRDKQVRLRALRVLPLTPGGSDCVTAVHRGLADNDEDVCLAAAHAAGRMRMESALVSLARCLRLGKVELARAAASALAAIPPRGWDVLNELTEYPDPITASAAHEALERARKTSDGV